MPSKDETGRAAPAANVRARARQQVDQLHAMIERTIDQGRIKPGERIATERALAAQFGASRSVVRSALAELHKAGKIVRKVGHGTIVQESPQLPRPVDTFRLLDTSPADMLDFRLALEPGLADIITLQASDADLAAIVDCVNQGDRASGLQEWEEWDRAFHRLVVAASHNRLAISVYDAVIGIRHEKPWLLTKQGHTDLDHWKRYQDDHRRIALSLSNRDAVGGAVAIRDHLLRVRLKMLGI
ncbi:FCD domain-containing protein [Lichenihabitans sp. PAMC28606]|uniref:FadR/GntR family transcriptional regulator n=1 Tax=Lichenihabitans sp. PAMC28606 TaxID=2880932 RepID=UPI001D09CFF6|nr:FCD domain-containing protein [Lichenihabitans sp. PAMC28606]UDL93756.1 FCD domain-containing protein [Lichenihabitans sp. PAMC28606]